MEVPAAHAIKRRLLTNCFTVYDRQFIEEGDILCQEISKASEELPFRFLTRLGWERSIISLEFSTSWCQFWGYCLPLFLIVVELHDLPQTSKCKTLTPGIPYIHGEPCKYPTGRAVLKCEQSPYWNDAGRTPEAANSKRASLGSFAVRRTGM